jgi:FtsH-binding integral membrane protein
MFVLVLVEIMNMISVVVEMQRTVSGIPTPCVLAFTSVVGLTSDVDAICIDSAQNGTLPSVLVLSERLNYCDTHI